MTTLKQTYISSLYLLLLMVFIYSCNKSKGIIKNQNENLTIVKIKKSEIPNTINMFGSISYLHKAEITSKVLGRVEKFFKEEGNVVSKGTALAKIETLNLEIQLQKDMATLEVQSKQIALSKAKLILAKQRVEKDLANIDKAKAEVADAKAIKNNILRTVNNKKELFKIGAIAETELKAVETSLNSAEISLFKAETNLKNLELGYRIKDLKTTGIPFENNQKSKDEAFIKLNSILEQAEYDMSVANYNATQKNVESTELLIKESTLVSPIPGVIASRLKGQGEAVKESEPVYIVVDINKVLLKFNINETDLWKIHKDQIVNFTVDAYPDSKFSGKVFIISPIVDPQSRTVEIKVISSNEKTKLKPGMFTRGKIILENKQNVFELPKNCFLNKESLKESGEIFVMNDKNFLFKKKVTIIQVNDDTVLFTSNDLQEGDSVAHGDLKSIKDGHKYNSK